MIVGSTVSFTHSIDLHFSASIKQLCEGSAFMVTIATCSRCGWSLDLLLLFCLKTVYQEVQLLKKDTWKVGLSHLC